MILPSMSRKKLENNFFPANQLSTTTATTSTMTSSATTQHTTEPSTVETSTATSVMTSTSTSSVASTTTSIAPTSEGSVCDTTKLRYDIYLLIDVSVSISDADFSSVSEEYFIFRCLWDIAVERHSSHVCCFLHSEWLDDAVCHHHDRRRWLTTFFRIPWRTRHTNHNRRTWLHSAARRQWTGSLWVRHTEYRTQALIFIAVD